MFSLRKAITIYWKTRIRTIHPTISLNSYPCAAYKRFMIITVPTMKRDFIHPPILDIFKVRLDLPRKFYRSITTT